IEDLFPMIWEEKTVQNDVAKHKK
ncbi:MAG: hypothetical protein RLZZ479_781, partial [Bacteroidota bacterium]